MAKENIFFFYLIGKRGGTLFVLVRVAVDPVDVVINETHTWSS
jgi:hypothetical protein